MKYLFSIVIGLLINTLIFGVFGFLLLPGYGERWGLFVYLVVVLLLLLTGGRLVYAKYRARKLNKNKRLNRIAVNIAFLAGKRPVDLYRTPHLSNDILFFPGIFSRPSVIFGDRVESEYNDEEVACLLELFTNNECRRYFIITYLLNAVYFPFLFIHEVIEFGPMGRSLSLLFRYMFFPIYRSRNTLIDFMGFPLSSNESKDSSLRSIRLKIMDRTDDQLESSEARLFYGLTISQVITLDEKKNRDSISRLGVAK